MLASPDALKISWFICGSKSRVRLHIDQRTTAGTTKFLAPSPTRQHHYLCGTCKKGEYTHRPLCARDGLPGGLKIVESARKPRNRTNPWIFTVRAQRTTRCHHVLEKRFFPTRVTEPFVCTKGVPKWFDTRFVRHLSAQAYISNNRHA